MLPSTTSRSIPDRITCRQILNIMVLLGFMLNYMLRVNLTFAIVEMVDASDTFAVQQNVTTNVSSTQKFHWDVYQKNQVLGSFYWGYTITQLPGGRLSEIIGARKVFGGGILAASILSLLTPVSCQGGYMVVAVLRAMGGFFLGVTLPTTATMAAKWIPPLERSKFMSHIVAASLGTAIAMPLCAIFIDVWGWESVFYITGAICFVWSIAWFLLIYDSPAEHPRISPEEREEIESKMAEYYGNESMKSHKVPWLAILISLPVWANTLAHASGALAYHMVLTQLPTYMKEVLHYDIKLNGLLSSLPYIANYAMAVLSGYVADHLLASRRFSTVAVRKFFTLFSVFIPGVLMAVQGQFGYIPTLSVTIFTATLFSRGSSSASQYSNSLDLSPNFSGTILGIGNTLGSLGGWLSTLMVAEITVNDNSFSQWKYIFWIMFATQMFGAFMFFVFGSATLQPWNSPQSTSQLDIELKQQNNVNNDSL